MIHEININDNLVSIYFTFVKLRLFKYNAHYCDVTSNTVHNRF